MVKHAKALKQGQGPKYAGRVYRGQDHFRNQATRKESGSRRVGSARRIEGRESQGNKIIGKTTTRDST